MSPAMGCSQAVRHQTLTLAFVGPNPAIPANKKAPSRCFFVDLRVHGGGLQKRRSKAEKRTVVRTPLLTSTLPSRFFIDRMGTILST